jgi:MinD superfamily P-loop ATPase
MFELVIISGKGGTGKTSITASFAALMENKVIADCDVDAADMHLMLPPRIRQRQAFWSGFEARIRPEACTACGRCIDLCRFGAITKRNTENGPVCEIDPAGCEGCGVCVRFCPEGAIAFEEGMCGEWFISDTDRGPMVHAKLKAAAENSGKLVSLVRSEAKKCAEAEGRDHILVDGPPGIGCPVIASLTGADAALIVTEPTLSGRHDMERVHAVAKHFAMPVAICVNRWDINPQMTDSIREYAQKEKALFAGGVRYDRNASRAQLEVKPLVELDLPAAEDIRGVWRRLHTEKFIQ